MTANTKLTGILLMLASTAIFVVGDCFLKLASDDIPAFQLVFMRSVIAVAIGSVYATATAEWRDAPRLWTTRTLLRSLAEASAAIFFMLGLASLAIPDVFAIAQTVPLFILFGAAVIYGDRLTPHQIVLALIGFGGAMLVAQPSFTGLSIGFVFAFAAAISVATRDLMVRKISNTLPAMLITNVTNSFVIILAGGFMMATVGWKEMSAQNFLYVLGAGLCVAIGQTAVVLAYRRADTTTLAPMFYSFAIWSVLSGLLVFGDLPNTLALAGIALIVVSGLLLVRIGQKQTARS